MPKKIVWETTFGMSVTLENFNRIILIGKLTKDIRAILKEIYEHNIERWQVAVTS